MDTSFLRRSRSSKYDLFQPCVIFVVEALPQQA